MEDKSTPLHNIMKNSMIYTIVQTVLGARKSYVKLVDEFLSRDVDLRVLDVGCGPAEILEVLPPGVSYTGVDMSTNYISAAREKWGERGEFICCNVDELDLSEQYDLIIATGLLHHLEDDQVRHLIRACCERLAAGGRFVAVDPVFHEGQNFLARWLAEQDRGQHVRFIEAYDALLKSACPSGFRGATMLRTDRLHIPYSHCLSTIERLSE